MIDLRTQKRPLRILTALNIKANCFNSDFLLKTRLIIKDLLTETQKLINEMLKKSILILSTKMENSVEETKNIRKDENIEKIKRILEIIKRASKTRENNITIIYYIFIIAKIIMEI
jgi:hypothetical protein